MLTQTLAQKLEIEKRKLILAIGGFPESTVTEL